jgi:predicted GIY-YIG superfamily endonuclease
MQFWVYMLRCRDGSYYAGHTDDLQKRFWEHQQGVAADWTRRRRPVELAWCAPGSSRDEVFAFERRIKNWSRTKKEALIAGDGALVGHFAKPPHERPSTSLGTSEDSGLQNSAPNPPVPSGARNAQALPSEVEGSKGAGTESNEGQ